MLTTGSHVAMPVVDPEEALRDKGLVALQMSRLVPVRLLNDLAGAVLSHPNPRACI